MAAKNIKLSQKRKIYKRRWATTLKRNDGGSDWWREDSWKDFI